MKKLVRARAAENRIELKKVSENIALNCSKNILNDAEISSDVIRADIDNLAPRELEIKVNIGNGRVLLKTEVTWNAIRFYSTEHEIKLKPRKQ